MRVISVFFVLCCVILAIAACSSLVTALPELKIKTHFDSALEKRMDRSKNVQAHEIKEMLAKDIREHLTWRGETCDDCDSRAKLEQALTDHIHAGTTVSTKQYSETSAKLRSWRSKLGLGDNPRGNTPEDALRLFEARRRQHEDPNDPLSGFKNVLGAHGYDVKAQPFATSHSGQKEVADFLASHRERARNHDPGRRDEAHQRAEIARKEREAAAQKENGNGDL